LGHAQKKGGFSRPFLMILVVDEEMVNRLQVFFVLP